MCAQILGGILGATMETAGAVATGAATVAAETAMTAGAATAAATGVVAAETALAAGTVAATEGALAGGMAAGTLGAETATTLVVDTAAATAVESAVTLAEATPALAETQIANIASGNIFTPETPKITAPKANTSFTKETDVTAEESFIDSLDSLQDDEAFLDEVTFPLEQNDNLSSINDEGELTNEALEDEKFLEEVTAPLAENADQPFYNESQDYIDEVISDEQNNPNIESNQFTAQEQVDQFNQQLKNILQDFIEKTITEEERNKLLEDNEKKRQDLYKSLMNRLEEEDDSLTPFEREVAKEGLEMREITREVANAPRVFDAMEKELKSLKDKYKLVSNYGDSDNPTEIQHSTGLREYLANRITGQAVHMAKYAESINHDVNDFNRKNRKVENLIGVNDGFFSVIQAIGHELQERLLENNTDTVARTIAKTGKMPR